MEVSRLPGRPDALHTDDPAPCGVSPTWVPQRTPHGQPAAVWRFRAHWVLDALHTEPVRVSSVHAPTAIDGMSCPVMCLDSSLHRNTAAKA